MKRILFVLVLSTVVVSFAGIGHAGTIRGELVKIDGEFYVVKDGQGRETRVHFNETTKVEGDIKPGLHVEIDESAGHANSIKVRVVGSGQGPQGGK